MDFACRWILHELYGGRIQTTELPRQVKRFAPDPDVGADTQDGFRFAHATGQREQERHACKNAQISSDAPKSGGRFHAHAPSGTKMQPSLRMVLMNLGWSGSGSIFLSNRMMRRA